MDIDKRLNPRAEALQHSLAALLKLLGGSSEDRLRALEILKRDYQACRVHTHRTTAR